MELRPILSTLRRHKITAWLLILEIALTCAIVCNAVFLISQRLQRMDLPSGIAEHELVQIRLGQIGKSPDAKAQTATDLAALRQIPGVQQAAVVNQLPFVSGASSNSGIMLKPDQQQPTVNGAQYMGSADLMAALGLHLVAGRTYQPDEYVDMDFALAALQTGNAKNLPHTTIITRALANRLWPGEEALGKTMYVGKSVELRVVGIVASLARPNQVHEGVQYSSIWPIRLTPADGGSYVLRCAPQDRQAVLKAAIAKLKQLDPNRVITVKQTYDEARRAFFADDRAMAGILIGVIVLLLVVTALGITGLASFWVGQRRRTIGVRRALGATHGDILRYFQTENFLLATFGIVLGMALAFGLNLFLMTHYELPRLPGIYFPVGALALWIIGQLAVLGPALRAAAVPPVVATRSV